MEKNRPEIVLVAAVARNGVIGRDKGMPWHVPEDLRRFKRLTVGHPILMGRKTFESIGRPLPGRHSIVLTRDMAWKAEDSVSVVHDLATALDVAGIARGDGKGMLMVLGGGEIYRLTLPIATRLEITEIWAEPEGDAFFPAFDRRQWVETGRKTHEAAHDVPGHAFVTWERRLESGVAKG